MPADADAHFALGVLSGTSRTHAQRREAIRESWLRFERRSLAVRFVLRCGGLNGTLLTEEARLHPDDSLCTPLSETCRSDGCRTRGTIMALVHWLRHALVAFSSCQLIGKADDDVFLHLPDVEAHFRTIPARLVGHAYYGTIKYFHWLDTPRSMELRGWGPSFGYAQQVGRRQQLSESCDASTGCSLAGPFPFACGQLFGVGAQLVRTLLAQPGLQSELERIARLPDSNPLVTEDGWLGSALARFVGSSAPVSLFSLSGEHHLWLDPVDYSLRISTTNMVYHNRNMAPRPRRRWHRRMHTIYDFARAAHCTAATGWQPEPMGTCCAAATVGAVNWPVYQLEGTSRCASDVLHDLSSASVLRRWNVSVA